jgi:riboflavin kinase / FMN adenylyltransferase
MKVFTQLELLPAFKNAVVTIGTFDGVHKGHRMILQQLRREAQKYGGETVLVTFHPHPRKVLGKQLQVLSTPEERVQLLEKQEVDNLVIVPFDESFASMEADTYVRDFLVKYFHPCHLIIGYDHRFGKDRSGDYHLLEKMGPDFGFTVKEIPEQVMNDSIISSTRIRQAIVEGDVTTATAYLGYPYFFSGTVVEGNKMGRTLGFPTANLHIADPDKLIPARGVYAVRVDLPDGTSAKGMMNIGVRPTVGGNTLVIEVHVFDFDGNLYDTSLRVHVVERLRSEKKMDGLEALKNQLQTDEIHARNILA